MTEPLPPRGSAGWAGDDPRDPRDAPDDVDRLFARLQPLPAPRDFAANVLLAARAHRPVRHAAAWAVGELVAVVTLAFVAFLAGQALVGGGTVDLLRTVLADAEVFWLLPGETALAIVESVPWIELAGIVLCIAGVWLCGRHLGTGGAEPPHGASRVGGA